MGTEKHPPVEDVGVYLHRLTRSPAEGAILERLPKAEDGLEIVLFDTGTGSLQWRVLIPEVLVKLKSITITRAEGPSKLCGIPEVFVNTLEPGDGVPGSHWEKPYWISGFIKASSGMRAWGHSAPTTGYDKCDFRCEWEDGTVYEGRFDLQRGGTDGGEYFADSFRSRVRFYSGLAPTMPHIKSRDLYTKIVDDSPGAKRLCRHILAHCEL
jgi:hypothetical protein